MARKEGDFLLVGLHSDEDVAARRGPHLPLMDLHERSLSVLACKYVDEVVIGAAAPLPSPPRGCTPCAGRSVILNLMGWRHAS